MAAQANSQEADERGPDRLPLFGLGLGRRFGRSAEKPLQVPTDYPHAARGRSEKHGRRGAIAIPCAAGTCSYAPPNAKSKSGAGILAPYPGFV
jgi:hypothetical protein